MAVRVLVERAANVSSFLLKNSRYYRIKGIKDPVPSVTSVLQVIDKPGIAEWQMNLALASFRQRVAGNTDGVMNDSWLDSVLTNSKGAAARETNRAADFGTRCHAVIESILQGKAPAIPEDIKPVVDGWLEWQRYEKLTIHLTETTVYSTLGFAGTIDAVATRANKPGLVLLDWKTSNQIYPVYALQLAAYAKAVEESTGERVSEAWVVRLEKTKPKFQAKMVSDLELAFSLFQGALTLHRYARSGSLFGATVSSFSVSKDRKKAAAIATAMNTTAEEELIDEADADADAEAESDDVPATIDPDVAEDAALVADNSIITPLPSSPPETSSPPSK